jgi:hypothetical protein
VIVGYYCHKEDKELTGLNVMVVLKHDNGQLEAYCPSEQHFPLTEEYFNECVRITKEQYVNASSLWTPAEYLN